jgi:hypothetical protein
LRETRKRESRTIPTTTITEILIAKKDNIIIIPKNKI